MRYFQVELPDACDCVEELRGILTTSIEQAVGLDAVVVREHDMATEEEIDEARKKFGSEEVEIDSPTETSRADYGLWVKGWLWLDRPPAEEDEEEDEDVQA